jgi:hypothetical protein
MANQPKRTAVVHDATHGNRFRQWRREPTAIVARPASTNRIGPHLPEGSRHPAEFIDDMLDPRLTLDSTDIPQM